jgi:hypothetical protein
MTKLIIIGVIALAALGAIGGIAAKIYSAGRQAERTAALTKGVELVKERDKLDVQIRTATPADICARLGGRWVPDNGGECD